MENSMESLINKLNLTKHLSLNEWEELIKKRNEIDRDQLFALSEKVRRRFYGNKIYIRGLLEFSNL